MIDKEWLSKLFNAYKVYCDENGNNPEIYNFIAWIYKQYGIEFPPTKY